MATLTATFEAGAGRVQLTPGDTDPAIRYRIERSLDAGSPWLPVRGMQNITSDTPGFDYEYSPGIENLYRLVGPVVSDWFERTEANSWGDADTGQTWVLEAGDAADMSVDEGRGIIGGDFGFFHITDTWEDIDLIAEQVLTDVPDINIAANIYVRTSGSGLTFSGYVATVTWNILTDSNVHIGIQRLDAGTTTTLATSVPVGAWAPGQVWRIRLRAVGDVITAKAWQREGPEPASWPVSATDDTHADGGIIVATVGGHGRLAYESVRAETIPATIEDTATVTPEQADVWLKSLQFPALNRNLGCVLTGEQARRGRSGIFDIIGRSTPVAVIDVSSTQTFTITTVTHTKDESAALVALLTYGSPLLLQAPLDDENACENYAGTPTVYVVSGDSTQLRPIRGKRGWIWTITLTVVAKPSDNIQPTNITWRVLWELADTWTNVRAQWDTWADLLGVELDWSQIQQAFTGSDAP